MKRVISYSVNWMGPINKQWVEEHGNHWAGGRIDIREYIDLSEEKLDSLTAEEELDLYELSPWGEEYGLPIMHSEDWCRFRDWLSNYKTEKLVPYKQIIDDYEKTNPAIRWFNK